MKPQFIFILILLSGLHFSCGKDNKELATDLLKKAETHYASGEYASSRLILDSLKKTYPKEVYIQKEGLQLMRKIELEEQQRNFNYCDSMLVVCSLKADSLKKKFVFEKNKEYDDVGKYTVRQQSIENNLKKSYIRCGVNELGEMYLASVYYGSNPINHKQIKVSAPSGEYAETELIPKDGGLNYSFRDLGATTEIVTYQKGKDAGVIQFICNNYKGKIKVEYIGDRNYYLEMTTADKYAVIEIKELSTVLSDIEHLKKEKIKAQGRLEYLKTKTQ